MPLLSWQSAPHLLQRHASMFQKFDNRIDEDDALRCTTFYRSTTEKAKEIKRT